jgi:hypothetical protein
MLVSDSSMTIVHLLGQELQARTATNLQILREWRVQQLLLNKVSEGKELDPGQKRDILLLTRIAVPNLDCIIYVSKDLEVCSRQSQMGNSTTSCSHWPSEQCMEFDVSRGCDLKYSEKTRSKVLCALNTVSKGIFRYS